MPVYTRSDLKAAINSRIHGKIGRLIDPVLTMNNAVRDAASELDMRSMKRRTITAPNLFDDIYDYAAPADMKGQAIIDLQPQGDRAMASDLILTSDEEFDRRKSFDKTLVSVVSHDGLKKIRAALRIDDKEVVISTLDTIASGGTWIAFGDGTNLRNDADDFIKGNGSIRWDINAAGGTTAGIQASDITAFSVASYLSGSFFVWAKITSPTNITNFKLRVGSSSSVYYEVTVTATNEGVAFQAGWNLLRFDMTGRVATGTPVDASCTYVAVFMTKTAGKVSEVDYRFDHVMMKVGKFYFTAYYSRYPWQDVSGNWKAVSTLDTDLLNAEDDEYGLFIEKAVMMAAIEAREAEDQQTAAALYTAKKTDYQMKNPSEALVLETTYYDFASIEGDNPYYPAISNGGGSGD